MKKWMRFLVIERQVERVVFPFGQGGEFNMWWNVELAVGVEWGTGKPRGTGSSPAGEKRAGEHKGAPWVRVYSTLHSYDLIAHRRP
mgnify:CR=1 FL=1